MSWSLLGAKGFGAAREARVDQDPSQKALTEIKRESTPASFSRVRGCISNMALGTVKRSIDNVVKRYFI